MTTQNPKKRKTTTQTSSDLQDLQDEIKDTFTSMRNQLTQDEALQQYLIDLGNLQETAFSCAKEMWAEVEEPQKLLKSERTEVECEIRDITESQLQNERQTSELERGLKAHDQFMEKLKDTPNAVIGQHSEELHKSLEVTYIDMEKRWQEGQRTREELQSRRDKLEMKLDEIIQDQHQKDSKIEKFLRLNITKDLVILKAYQSMLNIASEKQRQKEEDRSEIMDLRKKLELLSRTKDKEIKEINRQNEEDLSKIQQLEFLSRTKDKMITAMNRQKQEDLSKIQQLEFLSRSKDEVITDNMKLKSQPQQEFLSATNNSETGEMERHGVKNLAKLKELKKQNELASDEKPGETEARHYSKKIIGKKGKPAKDPNKPKRPPNVFFFFLEEFRAQLKQNNQSITPVASVSKLASEKWKSMSAARKAPYEQKAEKKRKDYQKQMTIYNDKKHNDAKEEEESGRSSSEDEESGRSSSKDNDDDCSSEEEEEEEEDDE